MRDAIIKSLAVFLLFTLAAACRQQMAEQPRYDPLEPSNFFADGQSSRPFVENTIAWGTLREDEHLYDGMTKGEPAATFPVPITVDVLQRGRERYDIFCSPCHSRTGNGEGMIVRRGFSRPASLHQERLREVSPGYLFAVIANGFGAMPPYRQQISAEDRWAIVGYLRALQASQNVRLSDLPADDREKLMAEPR